MKNTKKWIFMTITLIFGVVSFYLGKNYILPLYTIYVNYICTCYIIFNFLYFIIMMIISKKLNNNISHNVYKPNPKDIELAKSNYPNYFSKMRKKLVKADIYYYFVMIVFLIGYMVCLISNKPWFIAFGIIYAINFYKMLVKSISSFIFPNQRFIITKENDPSTVELIEKAAISVGIDKEVICFLNSNANIAIYETDKHIFISLGIFIIQLLTNEELYAALTHEFIKTRDSHSRKIYQLFESIDKWDHNLNKFSFHKWFILPQIKWIAREIPAFSDLSMYHFETYADSLLKNYCNPQEYLNCLAKSAINNIYMEDNQEEFLEVFKNDSLPLNHYNYIRLSIIDFYNKNTSLINQIIINELPDDIQASPSFKERLNYFDCKDYQISFDEQIDDIIYLINQISDMTYEHYNQIFIQKKSQYEYYSNLAKELEDKDISTLDNYTLNNLSYYHVKILKFTKALEENNFILKNNPFNSLAYYEIGNILLMQYNNEGIKYIEKAIELNYNFYFEGYEIIKSYSKKMGLIEEYSVAKEKLNNSKKFIEEVSNYSLKLKDKWFKTSLSNDEITSLLDNMKIESIPSLTIYLFDKKNKITNEIVHVIGFYLDTKDKNPNNINMEIFSYPLYYLNYERTDDFSVIMVNKSLNLKKKLDNESFVYRHKTK